MKRIAVSTLQLRNLVERLDREYNLGQSGYLEE